MLGGEAGRGTVKMTVERQCVVFEEVERLEGVQFKIIGYANYSKIFEEERTGTLKGWNMRRGHSFITEDAAVMEANIKYADNILEIFGEDLREKFEGQPKPYHIRAEALLEKIPNSKIRYIVWEEGGGMTNTGHATIIASSTGGRLKPIFVRNRGHLALSKHAAFAIWEGQVAVVVEASHHSHEFFVELYEITATKKELQKELIWHAEDFYPSDLGEVLPEKLSRYYPAVEAAIKKATKYHCREPFYVVG